MVDLHCHILPGLDDGPETLEAALEMARAATACGIDTVVATPHVRDDHPFPLALIAERHVTLDAALRGAGIKLTVLTGAEVDLAKSTELPDETLASLCLGGGPYLLVESPYTHAPSLLETALYDLQLRGFRPVLAHPERSASFLSDPDRLRLLTDRGVLCSVTAMSLTGAFGRKVLEFTAALFKAGMAHNVATDAHDAIHRPPDLGPARACLQRKLGCDAVAASWFTDGSGRAIVEGRHLDGGPEVATAAAGRRWRLRRLVGLK